MGVAVFLGVWFNYDQLYWNQLDSSGSEYGVLRLIGASADLSLNLVGTLESVNGSPCEAVGCTFGSIDIRGGVLKLDQCEVSGSIVMYGFSPASGYGDSFGKLMLTDCLVGGDIDYDIDHHGEEQWAAVKLVHNTVLGDVSYDFSSGWWSTVWPHHIRGNIVMGETAIGSDWAGWPPVISHNDFAGGATISASGDSIFANISEDPLFCGAPAGDYTLQECSPCAGTAHDGSDIGAFGVGCECWVVTEPKSWGAIKGMYR